MSADCEKGLVRAFKGMGELPGYGLVYKSGLGFFLTAKTKKLAIYSTVQYSTLFYIFANF